MADQFPTSFPIGADSEEEWIDDLRIETAADGTPYAYSTQTAKKRAFNIRTPACSTTERSTLETFYNTNRKLKFNFTWPADSSNPLCWFDGAPRFRYRSGAAGARWDIEFRVREA